MLADKEENSSIGLESMLITTLESLGDISQTDFGSHRTSADQIEHAVRELLLASDPRFKPPVSARSSGDVLYEGDVRCHINIKSTDTSKQFHMPNLISSNSLRRIYKRSERYYLLRILHNNGAILSKEAWDIMDISWEHLQIGALGAGQIQIRDGMKPLTKYQGTKDDWITEWQKTMSAYYQKEISKANRRMLEWLNL